MSTPREFDRPDVNAHDSDARRVWVAPKRTSLAVQRTSGTSPAAGSGEGAGLDPSSYAPTS